MIIAYDSVTKKEISREDIRQIVEDQGSWEGFSEEWRISTYTKYKIYKKNGEYHCDAICGFKLTANNFIYFEDAYMALAYLDTILWQIAKSMRKVRIKND